jgi:hypothetical protein
LQQSNLRSALPKHPMWSYHPSAQLVRPLSTT